ncbi:uncharacterized protein J3R85_021056 [Psidium guajava]|nr:uncharacterized protein J3R85_021056 [Psidium guajava]
MSCLAKSGCGTIHVCQEITINLPLPANTEDSAAQPNPPFLPKDPSDLSTDLIKAYFESGSVNGARVLFDEMPYRDIGAWTAMSVGYTFLWLPHRSMGCVL